MGIVTWLGIIAIVIIIFFMYLSWKAHRVANSIQDYDVEESSKGVISTISRFIIKCCKRLAKR